MLRQWAGLCDMTPDYSPIMGITPVDGFLVDVGWGTYGFKAGPVSGEAMAELHRHRQDARDHRARSTSPASPTVDLVGEKGAAAVGH